MPPLPVKKVVAVCFLEAVKTTLDHLGVHRLELSERGASAPPELTRAYGDGRRLRDYLQRCVSGFSDEVELDLADVDRALLVACCRRFVEVSEVRRDTAKLPKDEAEWLDKKMQVLAHYAVEIAEKPLLELPLQRAGKVGPATRGLSARINEKLFGEMAQLEKSRVAVPAARPTTQSSMLGVPSFADELYATPIANGSVPPVDIAQPVDAPPAPTPVEPSAATSPRLLDSQRVTEPRLRALLSVDLHAYERAVAACDWRMATIMAAAVLEVAVLDHVLPRQEELGLVGSPDTWDVQQLLELAMGDRAEPRDKALAAHLFAARNMLRPAVQMAQPTIVTQVSFERLRDFVRRELHGLGFAPTTTSGGRAADPWQPALTRG